MWQTQTFEHIQYALAEDGSVQEVVQLGSHTDQWSDVDAGIVVDERAFDDFFPSIEWIKQFGDIYAVNQSAAPRKGTSRVVFMDGTRVDFSIATNKAVLRDEAPPPSAEAQAASLQGLGNDFKFEAFLAASKVARNDLLIGLHLILELERKCLVLAMMLRDRDQGTTHHRHGGPYNEVVEELKAYGTTNTALLDRLQDAAKLFEKLAKQLEPTSNWDWQPLKRHLNEVHPRKRPKNS